MFYKKYDRQLLNPLRQYFGNIRNFIGFKSYREVNERLGHMRAEHCFRIDTMQFKLCSENTYRELIDTFDIHQMDDFKSYDELKTIAERFGRTFNLPDGERCTGNVLEYKKDYQGLHPTQKPIALLEHLVKTYTNKGDTVLDNCMGSGSTGVACVNTDRNFIGIELDQGYFEIAQKRINQALETKGGIIA